MKYITLIFTKAFNMDSPKKHKGILNKDFSIGEKYIK